MTVERDMIDSGLSDCEMAIEVLGFFVYYLEKWEDIHKIINQGRALEGNPHL